MNKLLKNMSRHLNPAMITANQNRFKTAPSLVDVDLKLDSQTYGYFENLDEDAKTMMARVLKDYVDRQR